MRLFILALVSSLAAVALSAASSSAVAARPVPLTPAIVDYHVQAGDTWTDPETNLTYRLYTITVDFTHNRGLIGVQVHEYAAANDELLLKDNSVVNERTIGTDSITLGLGYGLVGHPVYFKLFLYKPEQWYGKPWQRAEVIYDTETTGTYSD